MRRAGARSARRVHVLGPVAACALALLAAARSEGRGQAPATRFAAVDVVIDVGPRPLAAWQVELVDRAGRARWTAVEGGAAPAFRDAPRHDPRALARGRIALAALSVDEALPSGATRVATVHYAIEGTGEPDLVATLVAAADDAGQRIAGVVVLR